MNETIKNSYLTELNNNGLVSNRLKFIIDKIDLSDSKTILDIGSWHLEQSLELCRIFPKSKIYAFEPVPNSFNLCVNKLKNYGHQYSENIDVFNLAVSDVNGTIKFYEVDPLTSSHPNVGASSTLKFINGLNGSFFGQTWNQKEIDVTSVTLDSWCDEHKIESIDIIWIDVQGAELNVFKSGDKILNNTKVIFTEVGLKPYYDGHSMQSDIDSFLKSKGFVEIEDSFELNGFDYEANTIYVNKKYL
jgi:FkbM family methyltransferase